MPEDTSQLEDNSCLSSDTSSLKYTSVMTSEQKEWLLASLFCDQLKLTGLLRKNAELSKWRNYIDGNTALHYAAQFGDCSAIRLLAGNYGADVDARNNLGRTPLHLAAAHARAEAIHLLTSVYGANTSLRDCSGRLPRSYLPVTKEGKSLRKFFKDPTVILANDVSNSLYLLLGDRSAPTEGKVDGAGFNSSLASLRSMSNAGLGHPELSHSHPPIYTQFPWRNADSSREASPARRPCDNSFSPNDSPHYSHGSPASPRSVSQDRATKSKRKRTLEHLAAFSLNRSRHSENAYAGIRHRRMGERSKAFNRTTGTNLADDIYASVRRRRELTAPIYNPQCPDQSPRSPGSTRVLNRRRGIQSICDGSSSKPQRPVEDPGTDSSGQTTPTNTGPFSS